MEYRRVDELREPEITNFFGAAEKKFGFSGACSSPVCVNARRRSSQSIDATHPTGNVLFSRGTNGERKESRYFSFPVHSPIFSYFTLVL
jgi:hypothetical protein